MSTTALAPVLVAPPAKPHASVVRMLEQWYVACASSALKPGALLNKTIAGVPLVVYRGKGGEAAALLDRCCHRNVPLSRGKVVGEHVQCGYHGWEFDGGGACRVIPGLMAEVESKGRRVASFAVREQQGWIWVFLAPDTEPDREPFHIPYLDEPGYDTVSRTVSAPGTMHATIENALDVPHTAYLHAGLFRGTSEPNEIECVVRRWSDRVEAQFIGEPRPEGLIGRVLSPSGGEVTHYDRFFLPSILQVEYRIGTENHIIVTGACTPVSDFVTELHASVSFNLRLPHWLVKLAGIRIGLKIFGQDAVMLASQTDTIRTFGGEQFVSTEIDVLGGHIWRLMKQAERGEAVADGPQELERTFKLRA